MTPSENPGRARSSNNAMVLMLVSCVAAIVYGSLVPLEYKPLEWNEAVLRFRSIRDLEIGVARRADWVANLLLYIPLGFLATMAAGRLSRSLWWRLPATVAAALMCTALAVVIEFTQLWFPKRTVSQNDLVAEAIGSCVGAVLGLSASAWGATLVHRLGIVRRSLPAVWRPAYLLCLGVYSLLPGDFVISADEFRQMLSEGKLNLVLFADLKLTVREALSRVAHVVLFTPLGYLIADRVCVCRSALSGLLLSVIATGLGGMAGLAIEIAQLGVYTRESSVTAIFFAAAGTGLGGLAYAWLRRPEEQPPWFAAVIRASGRSFFWRFAAVGYASAVLLVMLAPFGFVEGAAERIERWGLFMRVPFAALYVGSEFAALTNVLQKGLIFCVFGAFLHLALRPEEIGGRQSSIGNAVACGVLATLLGAGVEIAQVYLDAHQPDSTDVLIYTSSALIGRRACESTLRAGMTSNGTAHRSTTAV